MITVVFSDRDGTINKDEDYYLGSSPSWKSQVEFLPGVVEGIKLINSIPNSYFFIVTNQAGVALDDAKFRELDEKRMNEVNNYIVTKLKEEGARIDGYYACPYVDTEYVEKARKKGRNVNQDFVKPGHLWIKPKNGMMEQALLDSGLRKEECEIFMIGDRMSDIEMGLNFGATGILIESWKTKDMGDIEKVTKMKGQVYIAKDFIDAVKYITKNRKNQSS